MVFPHLRRKQDIITKQPIALSILGKSVQVVCDDTDVFALLVHFYHSLGKGSPMIMSSPVKERAVIDIKQTAASHIDIASDLLALHGLSGADTVSAIHGIGKTTVVNLAKRGELSLSNVRNIDVDMELVIAQATKFICSAYGQTIAACDSMTECRVKLLHLKTGKSGTKSIKLKAIPPTNSAFIEHVNRAHMQVAIWKSALQDCPTDLDPTEYGWEIYHQDT